MIGRKELLPDIRHAFIILFVTFVVSVLFEILTGGMGSRTRILVFEGMIVLPAIIYSALFRLPFREVFRWKKVDFRILAASAGIGLGLSVLIDEIDRLIQSFFPMPEEIFRAMEDMLRFQTLGEFLAVAGAGVFVAGVAEEMLFRGFFQGALERKLETTRAVNITALVFALVHFNPWWVVEILILGVILGVLAWRTGSIFPAMAVHMINNAVAVFLMNTRCEGWYLFKGHVSPPLLLAGIAGIFFLFRFVYQCTEDRSNPNGK